MPLQKPQHLQAAEVNFECWVSKFLASGGGGGGVIHPIPPVGKALIVALNFQSMFNKKYEMFVALRPILQFSQKGVKIFFKEIHNGSLKLAKNSIC